MASNQARDTKRRIAIVPDVEVLRDRSVTHWTQRFQTLCGKGPTEIVLPAVATQGVSFDSKHVDPTKRLTAANLLPAWTQTIRQQLGNEPPIWASVNPSYPFM